MKKYLLTILVIALAFSANIAGVSAQAESATCVNITKFLREGDVDVDVAGVASGVGDVTKLQLFLTDYGTLNVPEGQYGYFGTLTTKALLAWQKKVGVVTKDTSTESVEYGKTGPLTRAKIKEVSCLGVKPTDPTITVTAPIAGATFVAGTNIKAIWKTTNMLAAQKLKVELVKGSVVVSSQDISNTKSFQVKTEKTLVAGNDYKVRVSVVAESNTTAALSAESGVFSITAPEVKLPAITVVEPTAGVEVTVGKNIQVKWTTENIVGGSYKVELYKGDVNSTDSSAVLVSSFVSNIKSKLFKIPADAVPGSDYFFKVTHTKGEVVTEDKSDAFKVLAVPAPAILITSPNSDSVLSAIGGTMTVTWASVSLKTSEKVLVELIKDGIAYAYDVSTNDGKQLIRIPKNAPVSENYTVRITYSGDEASAPVVAKVEGVNIVAPAVASEDSDSSVASVGESSRGILDILLDLFR